MMTIINSTLKEASGPHISFFFGRLNPPHFGHQGLIQTTITSAKNGAWAGFLSKSQDKKKNPLPYDLKLRWLYTLYPETKGHIVEDPNIKTFLQAAAYLYEKGFRSATFVAGEDDMASMRPVLEQYNGKEVAHGFYKFEPLTFMESPRLTSATNAREAAKSGDPEAFERATQVPQNIMVDGKTLMQAVRIGLGLGEAVEENITEAAINDGWFSDGFQTYKKPVAIKYETASSDGTLQTLEGPVQYKAGYKIVTGPKGEKYPMPPEKFASLYDDSGNGVATPKKIMKVAKLADHDGVVNTSWGEPLNYTAGADYIVKHGPNDYGVVKKDIFAQTYAKPIGEAPGIGGDWDDLPKLVKVGRKPYKPNVDDTYYGSTHGIDLDLYGLPKYELDEDLTPDQWAELRIADPKAYMGNKDYTNRRWWTLQFKKARAAAREKGAQRFEFPPVSKNSYMVAPDLANEGKVKLYTDPDYFGAEVDDSGFDSLPIINIPTKELVGFEPDEKMKSPKAQANVAKIIDGIKKNENIPPILVRKYKSGYQVLDGHHRFWAYKTLKKDSIPARLVPDSDIEEISKNKVNEAAEKSTKSVAKYQDMPRNGQRCDHCTMWRPPQGCSAVSGKIAANGWCSYYKRSHRKDLEESTNKNIGSYKGKPFYIGVFDTRDGHVLATYTYEKAAENDFHHNFYVADRYLDAIDNGEAALFWMNSDGSIETEWTGGKASPQIVRTIQSQLDEGVEPLTELATDVLYHYTGTTAAAEILTSGEFKLSNTVGSDWEYKLQPKGYPYFLSTTRSRSGGYHKYVGNSAVMFVLDGRWLNQNYKVKPIDYWNDQSTTRHRESEDRVFSRDGTIAITPVMSVHVLIKEQHEFQSPAVRRVLLAAKKRGIPTYLYADEEAWRLQNTAKSITIGAAKNILKGPQPSRKQYSRKSYLAPYVELLFGQNRSTLSKEASKILFDLRYYNIDGDDFGLRRELSNSRKPGDTDYENGRKIVRFMQQNNIKDTMGVIEYIKSKWMQKAESIEEALDPNETHGWILPDRKVVYVPPEYHEGYLHSQGIDGYEAAFKLGYVRFAKATVTFFVQGTLPDLRKTYRVYAQTALGFQNIAVDIIIDGTIDNQLSYDYVMPRDKVKFMRLLGPQKQSEHAPSILGTVGGGPTLTDRQVAKFPWDEYPRGDQHSPKIPWLEDVVLGDGNLITEELLNEVAMSSGALKKAVDALPLARAGLEFELICTEFEDDDDYDPYEDFDSEPDYDQDANINAESLTDLQNAIMDFFRGDHNTRRDIQQVQESIAGEYETYAKIAFDNWANSADVNVRGNSGDTRYQQWLDKTYGRDYEKQGELFPEIPPIDAYMRFTRENYEKWYDKASEDGSLVEDFLDSVIGGDTYSDIHNYFSGTINWPHWTEPDYDSSRGRGDGPPARSFSQAVGYDIQVSGGYHTQRQKPNYFKVEPDSSLHASSGRGGEGWEFVSPPLTIPQMVDVIKKVAAWAKSGNAYTNKTTGLHMNVSLPGYSLQNLDYVKMALFLGDKYVLDTFGRLGNNYAVSALDKVATVIKRDPSKAEQTISMIRTNLNKTVSKMIHDTNTDKFTSINTKDNRIEIRSPGGNWLDMDLDKVINTLYRTVYALSIAIDPEAEKQEYAKKFYKLLATNAPKEETDTIKYFSQYVSGTIPKTALLSFVRNEQRKRAISRDKKGSGVEEYEVRTKQGTVLKKFYGNDPYEVYSDAREWTSGDSGYYLQDVMLVRLKNSTYVSGLMPGLPPLAFVASDTGIGSGSNRYEIVYKDTELAVQIVRADNKYDASDLAFNWLRGRGVNYNNYELKLNYMGVNTYYNVFTANETRRSEPQQTQTPQDAQQNFMLFVNGSRQTTMFGTLLDVMDRARGYGRRIARDGGYPDSVQLQAPSGEMIDVPQYITRRETDTQTVGQVQPAATIPQMPYQTAGGVFQMRTSSGDRVIAQGTYTTTQEAIAAAREYANRNNIALDSYNLFRPNETQQASQSGQQQSGGTYVVVNRSDGTELLATQAQSFYQATVAAQRFAQERSLPLASIAIRSPNNDNLWDAQGQLIPQQRPQQPEQQRQYADWEIQRGYDIAGNTIPPEVIAQHRATPQAETTYNIVGSMGGVYHTFTAASETAARRYAQSWATEHNLGPGYTVVAVPERNESIEESLTESFLAEVKMNPKSLEAFAKSEFAQQMRVGFETEMYVPGLQGEEEDPEPDYDQDEDFPADETYKDRQRMIIDFFTEGDYGNSRRSVERALEAFYENFSDYVNDQYYAYEDTDQWKEAIADEVGVDDYSEVTEEQKDEAESSVRENWENENDRDNWKDFLRIHEIDTMQGFANYISRETNVDSLDWPYMTDMGSAGDVTYEDLVDSFENATGYGAVGSSGYHGTNRGDYWIFEPDSSLDSPEDYEDGGVELVSPPMLLDDALEALDKVFTWAKRNRYYTNRTTGFHIGVSVPDQTMANVNHLKLILLLGDKYVLDRFERLNSRWTKSMFDQAYKATETRDFRKSLPKILDDARAGLLDQTNRELNKIISGTRGDRYVSVNIKSNYIEFRSAGGNYFEKYDEIRNTMLRYVRAMAAAADPEDSKQEYHKKFYKLIVDSVKKDSSTVDIFAKYVTGDIDKEELVRQVQAVRKSREPIQPVGQGKITAKIETKLGDEVVEVHGEQLYEMIKLAYDWLNERNMDTQAYLLKFPYFNIYVTTIYMQGNGLKNREYSRLGLYPNQANTDEIEFEAVKNLIPNVSKEDVKNYLNVIGYNYSDNNIASLYGEIIKIERNGLDGKPNAEQVYNTLAYRIEDYDDHIIARFDPAKYTQDQVAEIADYYANAFDNNMIVYRGNRRLHWGSRNARQGIGVQDINHTVVVGSGKIEFYVISDTNNFVFVHVRGDSEESALANLNSGGYRNIANNISNGNGPYHLVTPTDYKNGVRKPRPQPTPQTQPQRSNVIVDRIGRANASKVFALYRDTSVDRFIEVGADTPTEAYEILVKHYKEAGGQALVDTFTREYETGRLSLREV